MGSTTTLNAAISLSAALLMLANPAAAGETVPHTPHWTYDGESGPAVWGTLDPHYAECGRGDRQSPIDLPVAAGLDAPNSPPPKLEAFHHEHVIDVINDGHTVKVVYDDGDVLNLSGATYRLVQYHFHAPSEHTFGGQHFPLELHLVHRADDGRLAVLAVMLEKGLHNSDFDPVLTHVPSFAGGTEHVEHVAIDVDAMLPTDRRAFAYLGSLTTPPCSEGVNWLVLRIPVTLDGAQIHALADVLHHNARPTQPVHGRVVTSTSVE